jgi:hypothetical protein
MKGEKDESEEESKKTWPPAIRYEAQEKSQKPKWLVKNENLLRRGRWLWTINVPLSVIGGLDRYSSHDVRDAIVFSFDAVMSSYLAIRAWLLEYQQRI